MKQTPSRGRPPKPFNQKKSVKVAVYLTPEDYEKYKFFKKKLANLPSPFTFSEFMREVIRNFDIGLIEYLQLSEDDPVKHHLKNKYLHRFLDDL